MMAIAGGGGTSSGISIGGVGVLMITSRGLYAKPNRNSSELDFQSSFFNKLEKEWTYPISGIRESAGVREK